VAHYSRTVNDGTFPVEYIDDAFPRDSKQSSQGLREKKVPDTENKPHKERNPNFQISSKTGKIKFPKEIKFL